MIILNEEMLNVFYSNGVPSNNIWKLLSGRITGSKKKARLIGVSVSEESYQNAFNKLTNRKIAILKRKAKTKRFSKKTTAKTLAKRNNKKHLYKIPEIRNEKVDPYSHPLLGKKEYSKFYSSTAWRQLRYLALKNTGGCQCCGAKASDGVQIHVDHIKPRSRYPELELSLSNIQVLCMDCNIGKGDWDNTDWRGVE